MVLTWSSPDAARGFASEYGIDVERDMHHNRIGRFTPVLARVDNKHGRSISHVTDLSGTDYYISRIDYLKDGSEVQASRHISIVMPGYRTKSAYWTSTATTKKFTVHRGSGYLLVGDPQEGFLSNDFKTTSFTLDPTITPTFTLPAGKFYTLEAASWSSEPLVVSDLRKMDEDGSWQQSSITVEPGEDIIVAPEGIVEVPDEFLTASFD